MIRILLTHCNLIEHTGCFFFNWASPEFAKCWLVSNWFKKKNVRVPDWPPPLIGKRLCVWRSVYLQRWRTFWWCCVPRVYKYGNFPLEKYASEHYTIMQVCPSTQMHQERKHVQKWTLKYAEEQSHWLARPSFCCLVTGRPSSSYTNHSESP